MNVSNPSAYFIYPGANGFAYGINDTPISGTATLVVGQKLDRFGSESGGFLAPLGAPYIERSLPPSNLFAPVNSSYPYNYHVYEVVRPFNVFVGPVAGWFEQPGFGSQFQLQGVNVATMIANGFLKRLDMMEYDEASDYAADYLPNPPQ